MPVIRVDDLVIRYGDVSAVNGITWQVERGEVVGLLGGNGAGKSSTLRALAGINPPTSGVLKIAGHDLGTAVGTEDARHVLGYCPDVGGLLRQSTVREHVALALTLHGRTDQWPAAMNLVERFDLLRVFDRVTQGFSHGMSRRLSVMLATLCATDVLILDEPFDGVDPTGVDVTLEVINEARNSGLGIVVSTHLLDLIAKASDRVVVLNLGNIVDEGPSHYFAGDIGRDRYAGLLQRSVETISSISTKTIDQASAD